MTRLTIYQKIIMEATGCDEKDVENVETILRQDVFHSTLDWQTREQLVKGAKEAYEIYNQTRSLNN